MSLRRLASGLAVIAALMALTLAVGSAAARDHTTIAVRVPNVTHMRLDLAQARLQIAGLRSKAHGGGIFGIVVKHNWEVCFQNPRAGKSVARHAKVDLYVSRPGEC